jgi:predicted outer membrane repeat protein
MVDEFTIKDSKMLGNLRNASEGALTVTGSTIIAVASAFESFHKAISLLQSSAYITNCHFKNNRAIMKGGALFVKNCFNITIAHSTFSLHACNIVRRSCTGAVLYSTHSELLITNCTFDKNKEGAINVVQSETKIFNSYFSENVARRGAAIQANYGGLTTITDTHFHYNEVDFDYYKLYVYTVAFPGGAIHCDMCKMEITRGVFGYNKGVALLGLQAQIKIKSCRFSHNTAAELGGGLYATIRTNIEISGTTLFENNVANYGAAFHSFYSIISIVGTISIVNNTANLGAIGIIYSIATIRANIFFSENIGSFFVYGGEVNIIPFYSGKAIFTRNYQINKTGNEGQKSVRSDFIREGGAITLFVSRLELRTTTILSHNVASNGGGIIAITSTIVCNNTVVISFNVVTDTGGGLYLHQSELSTYGHVTLANNRANVCGGGIHAISAFLKFILVNNYYILPLRRVGTISFESNIAEECGGGAFFEIGSKIYILQYRPNTVSFIKNIADYGGAIYVADDTNIGMCSSGQKHTLTACTQSDCFFQLASINNNRIAIITNAFYFKENQANCLGANLFGGLLDRCTVNSYSYKSVTYSSIHGFSNNIEQSSTSKPVRICLCNSTNQVVCNSQPVTSRIMKDEPFTIYAAAVDQLNHTVNATVRSYLL